MRCTVRRRTAHLACLPTVIDTSGFTARPVVQCSAVLCEQAAELSQQLLLLQSDTRHHALQPAAVCRPPQISDSCHMHPSQRHGHILELTCDLYSSMVIAKRRLALCGRSRTDVGCQYTTVQWALLQRAVRERT